MRENVAAGQWNTTCEEVESEIAPPVTFVESILFHLSKHANARGLHIGCDDGRNFFPLLDAGIDISGVDVSDSAVQQLRQSRPDLADKISCINVLEISSEQYDFLVSIEAFQHGSWEVVEQYFEKCDELLKAGGLLFLRVNACNTELNRQHTVTQMSPSGSFTVRCLEGEESGQEIHFFSQQELGFLAEDFGFDILSPPQEIQSVRGDGTTSSQWETVWQKCI